MGSPTAAETAKNLKNAVSMASTLDPLCKKAHADHVSYFGKLDNAVKKRDRDLIETYKPALEDVVTRMEKLTGTATGALVAIRGLREDKAFMTAKHKVVEALADRVAGCQETLTDDMDKANKLLVDADKALDAVVGDHNEAVKDYALLDADVKAIKKLSDAAAIAGPKLDAAARDAFAKGNQPAVTKARLVLIDLNAPAARVSILIGRVEKFRQVYKDDEYAKKATYLLDDLNQSKDDFAAVNALVAPLIALGQVQVAAKLEYDKFVVETAGIVKLADAAAATAPKLDAAARAAYGKGNQADLTKARMALIDLHAPATKIGVLKARIETFRKKYPGDFSKKGQTLIDDLNKAESDFKYVDDFVAPLIKLGQVPAAAAPKVNVPKAIKVLKLETGDTGRMTKILNGPPAAWEKQFDLWAKDNKSLAMTGKAIVTKLRKEQAIA